MFKEGCESIFFKYKNVRRNGSAIVSVLPAAASLPKVKSVGS